MVRERTFQHYCPPGGAPGFKGGHDVAEDQVIANRRRLFFFR